MPARAAGTPFLGSAPRKEQVSALDSGQIGSLVKSNDWHRSNNSFKPRPLRGLVCVPLHFHPHKAAKRSVLTQALDLFMKEFGDQVALQIHHLDEGEEANLVVSAIAEAAATSGCRIERPSEETNSILVHCEAPEEDKLGDGQAIQGMLEKATSLIGMLTQKNVDSIYQLDLRIMLSIQTSSDRVWLEPDLLKACAKHAIGISLYDMSKVMARISFPEEV